MGEEFALSVAEGMGAAATSRLVARDWVWYIAKGYVDCEGDDMTSKTLTSTTTVDVLEMFPDFPPRDDMQNYKHLYRPTSPAALEAHYGYSDTILVACEVPLSPSVGGSRLGVRIPDLMVAFGVAWSGVIARNGYAIDREGKPPDFVLEVASPHTARNDYTQKRIDYADFGVPEYWRFDPTGGDWYDAALAGDMLVDGRYQPIEVEWSEGPRWRGYSRVLGLYLCWEEEQLRFYDPERNRYLPTFPQESARADQADRRADQEAANAARATSRADQEAARADQEAANAARATSRADQEAARADQEAARADDADQRAIQADRRADQEAARADHAEEENRRLQQMLRDLGRT